MIEFKPEFILKLKYILSCEKYCKRKTIVKFFYNNVNNSIMNINCIYLVSRAYKNWIAYIARGNTFYYKKLKNIKYPEKQKLPSYDIKPIDKIKAYYSRIMELPCYSELNDNNSTSLNRPYFYHNNRLPNIMKNTKYSLAVMSEFVEPLTNKQLVKLMKQTKKLFINKMIDFYFKCTFEELCEYIISKDIPNKIFKRYSLSESPNIYYDVISFKELISGKSFEEKMKSIK